MPVPAGEDPRDQCAESAPASCGLDGTCDGAGACRRYVAGSECAPGSCSGSTESAASTCDGNGTCKAGRHAQLRAADLPERVVRHRLHQRRPVPDRVLLRGDLLPAQARPGRRLRQGVRLHDQQLRRRRLLQQRLHPDLPRLQPGGLGGHLHARRRGHRSPQPVRADGGHHLRHHRAVRRRGRLPAVRQRHRLRPGRQLHRQRRDRRPHLQRPGHLPGGQPAAPAPLRLRRDQLPDQLHHRRPVPGRATAAPAAPARPACRWTPAPCPATW